jgi:hypothetical protein
MSFSGPTWKKHSHGDGVNTPAFTCVPEWQWEGKGQFFVTLGFPDNNNTPWNNVNTTPEKAFLPMHQAETANQLYPWAGGTGGFRKPFTKIFQTMWIDRLWMNITTNTLTEEFRISLQRDEDTETTTLFTVEGPGEDETFGQKGLFPKDKSTKGQRTIPLLKNHEYGYNFILPSGVKPATGQLSLSIIAYMRYGGGDPT